MKIYIVTNALVLFVPGYVCHNTFVFDITIIIGMYQHGVLIVGLNLIKILISLECCSAQFNTREIMLCNFCL